MKLLLIILLLFPMQTKALSLTDIARQTPIEIGDYERCKPDDKGFRYRGWHDITIENGSITKNSIQVCKWLKKDELLHVVKHELWHQVHEVYLTPEQKKQWADLYTQATNEDDFLREYSSKNPNRSDQQNILEWFADIFSESYKKTPAKRSNLFQQQIDLVNSFKPTLKPQYNLFDFTKK